MIKAEALTERSKKKKKKPLGQKQENMIPHGEPRRQNRKRRTIRTPRATRLTLHHINPSTEREPWETSPAVTSPALIQPVTTSSRSTAAARADTLSHSVGRKKKKKEASDVLSCDQRESESWKLSTDSHITIRKTLSALFCLVLCIFSNNNLFK